MKAFQHNGLAGVVDSIVARGTEPRPWVAFRLSTRAAITDDRFTVKEVPLSLICVVQGRMSSEAALQVLKRGAEIFIEFQIVPTLAVAQELQGVSQVCLVSRII